MTLRKLKTVLPSLKPPVEQKLRSRVVYKIPCPRCTACYVGQTCRHIITRFKEHMKPSAAVRKHLNDCMSSVTFEQVELLASSSRSVAYLETLEALWIDEIKPAINTKDEFKSRTLTIKL